MRFPCRSSKPSSSSILILFWVVLFMNTGSAFKKMPLKGVDDEERALVAIHTEYGTMRVLLYNATPDHRDNFLKLAENGAYDSTSFHRVIEGFMIQGGDPLSKKEDPDKKIGNGGPGYKLDAEIRDSLIHKRGALAAARKPDRENPERRSNGAQFYIVDGKRYERSDLKKLEERKQRSDKEFEYSEEHIETYNTIGGAAHLDGAYTVFGQVVEGKGVIDKIADVKTNPSTNRPLRPVRMKVEILKRP